MFRSESEPRRRWSARSLSGSKKGENVGGKGLSKHVVVDETLGGKKYRRIVMERGDWDTPPVAERVVTDGVGGVPKAEKAFYGKMDGDWDAVRQASASMVKVNELIKVKTFEEAKTEKIGAREENDAQALGEKAAPCSEALMSGANVPVRSESKAGKRRSWRTRDKPKGGESDVKRTPPRIPLLFARSSLHLNSREFQVSNNQIIAKNVSIKAPPEKPIVIATSESRPTTRDFANANTDSDSSTLPEKVTDEKELFIEHADKSGSEDSISSTGKEKIMRDSRIKRSGSGSGRLRLDAESPSFQDVTAPLRHGDPEVLFIPGSFRGQPLRRGLSSNAFQERQEARTLGAIPSKNHSKFSSVASTSTISDHQQSGVYQVTLQNARTIPMQRCAPRKPTKFFSRTDPAPGPSPLSALPSVPEGQIEALPMTPRNSLSEQKNDGTEHPTAKSRSSLEKYSLYPTTSHKSPEKTQSPTKRNAHGRQNSGSQRPAALVTISNAIGSINNTSFPRPPTSPGKVQANEDEKEALPTVPNRPLPTQIQGKEIAVTPTKLARAEDMRENKMRQIAKQKSQKAGHQKVEQDAPPLLKMKTADDSPVGGNPRPPTPQPAEGHASLDIVSEYSSKQTDPVELSTAPEQSDWRDSSMPLQISPIMLITEQPPTTPICRAFSTKSRISEGDTENGSISIAQEIQLSPSSRSNLLKDFERAPSGSVPSIPQPVMPRPIADRKPILLIPDQFRQPSKRSSQWSSAAEMNLEARLSRLEVLMNSIATSIDRDGCTSDIEDRNLISWSGHWHDMGGESVQIDNGVNGYARKG